MPYSHFDDEKLFYKLYKQGDDGHKCPPIFSHMFYFVLGIFFGPKIPDTYFRNSTIPLILENDRWLKPCLIGRKFSVFSIQTFRKQGKHV